MALQSLAKVDPYCHLDGALAGSLPWPAGFVASNTDLIRARQQAAAQVAGLGQLQQSVAHLASTWLQNGIMHVDLVVTLEHWQHLGLGPHDLLVAIAAPLRQLAQQTPWSWSLVVEWPMDGMPAQASAALTDLTDLAALADPQALAGISLGLPAQQEVTDLNGWSELLQAAKAAGLQRQVVAETSLPLMQAAIDAGIDRLVGGTALVTDAALTGHLRAHRLPLVQLPSWQLQAGLVDRPARSPLGALRNQGVLVSVASGWPALLGATLTDVLQQVSVSQVWRLDDLRAATARAIEAAWLLPQSRMALGRMVESWRHRPHAQPGAKGDPFSL
jgi:hypothetical protein